MIIKHSYMHPTFSYFTLEDGSIVTYDVQEGIFLLNGVEHEFTKNDTDALQELLERINNVEELREYIS